MILVNSMLAHVLNLKQRTLYAAPCSYRGSLSARKPLAKWRAPCRERNTRCCVFSEGLPVAALLLSSGCVSILAEAHTKLGKVLSSPLIAMGCGITLSSTGILPVDCAAFDAVWQYIMPMGAACLLLETDFTNLGGGGAAVSAGFLLASVGMVVGASASYALLKGFLGAEGPKIACCLCASYIGGSANFAAVAKIVGLPPATIPAVMAVDNVAMAACLAALIAASSRASKRTAANGDSSSSSSSLNEAHAEASSPPSSTHTDLPTSANQPHTDSVPQNPMQPAQVDTPPTSQSGSVSTESISLSLAAAATSCSLGESVAASLRVPNLSLACMSIIAMGFAYVGSSISKHSRQQSTSSSKNQAQHSEKTSPFVGTAQIGGAFMAVFFTIIGASAGSLSAFAKPETPAILGLIFIMVLTHWAVMWVASKTLLPRLPLAALLLGSNACIGGPATAAGMAASKEGWGNLVQPAMMCGSLGYAVGTAAGLALWVKIC